MSSTKIRVGIIGAGGWASYGHIPALATLDDYVVTAVSSRSQRTAQDLATRFGVEYALDDYRDLVAHPEVDLVVIPSPGPTHADLARAAIAAGKDVYTEWPLTTTTGESEQLLALAEAKGVRHVVGLQRRFAPSASYVRELLTQGYVGQVRGVRMSVGVDAFPPAMPERYAWTIDPANFTNVLSVYAGHFGDLLFHAVGSPQALTAVTQNQFPHVTIMETGEQVPTSSANEVMVIGTLEGGGLFSVQIEGAQSHKTGLQIDITGTEGALRITNPRGFQNVEDNTVEGMTGAAETFSPLPVPGAHRFLGDSDLDASVQDVAYLYAAHARDVRDGTSTAANFADAVRMHRLIDQITASATDFTARTTTDKEIS